MMSSRERERGVRRDKERKSLKKFQKSVDMKRGEYIHLHRRT